MTLGDRIRLVRVSQRITQEELAKKIGVAKPTLANYERGIREPDALKLVAISKALGVSGDYLLDTGYDPQNETDEITEVVRLYKKLPRDSKDFVMLVIKHELSRPDQADETVAWAKQHVQAAQEPATETESG